MDPVLLVLVPKLRLGNPVGKLQLPGIHPTVNNNPVKRGYVDQPEHWRYSSSAPNYAGQEDLIEMMRVW